MEKACDERQIVEKRCTLQGNCPKPQAMNLSAFDLFSLMEGNDIMVSFKGEITSDLLTSIFQIVETRLDDIQEAPKVKKKVYNIMVECLQNLYHHLTLHEGEESGDPNNRRSAVLLIAKKKDQFFISTGNYILNDHAPVLREKLEKINSMNKDELRSYYREILANEELSEKGGGGLGIIDIARKSEQKLLYDIHPIDDQYSFFSLEIKI